MGNKVHNLAILAASTVLSIAVGKIEPAKAAYFDFSFGFDGSGSIEIEDSFETSFVSYTYYPSVSFPSPDVLEFFDQPIGTFDKFGNLIGVSFGGSLGSYSSADCRYADCYYTDGEVSISASGNQFVVRDFGSTSVYNEYDELISQKSFDYIADGGLIYLRTIEPLPIAVPEPMTILGTGTAIGFGTFFKRQLAKKSKKK